MISIDELLKNETVTREVRDVTTRLLETWTPTPRTHVYRHLDGNDELLATLVRYEFLMQPFGDILLPGFLAFEYSENAELRSRVKGCVVMVRTVLGSLLEGTLYEKRDFEFDEIMAATKRTHPLVSTGDVHLGLLLLPQFGHFLSGHTFNEARSSFKKVEVTDLVYKPTSIDDLWNTKLHEIYQRDPSRQSVPMQATSRSQVEDNVAERWQVIRYLGGGGQGDVHLVLDRLKVDLIAAANEIVSGIRSLAVPTQPSDQALEGARKLVAAVHQLREPYDQLAQGARKTLRIPPSSPQFDKAKERLKREIEVYETISHPNLLRLLDQNVAENWFVSEYHPGRTLDDHRDRFKGDLLGAMKALRPVIHVVAELHRNGFVHRDIKPGNIFISENGQLVLGDAGLVFVQQTERPRPTDTFENVGTRDYMPAWAMSQRIENITPTFDVFSLGKVLWSMVAGRPAPPLWYIHKPDVELARLFPSNPNVVWLNEIVDACVVEEESACLENAGRLLEKLDMVIRAIESHAEPLSHTKTEHQCWVCGLGTYRRHSDWNIGPNAQGDYATVLRCDRCGNIQIFY